MKYFPQLLEISFVETELISQNKPPKINWFPERPTLIVTNSTSKKCYTLSLLSMTKELLMKVGRY